MLSRPKLRAIVLLRCPHCLQQPLRKPGSWFEFNEGCPTCGYRYEREEGYFVGAPWMISYPILGIPGLIAAIRLYPYFSQHYVMTIFGAILALGASVLGLAFYPFARAIWLVADHLFNPLEDSELHFKRTP